MRRAVATWTRRAAEAAPAGVLSALSIGAWLALTTLLTVAGVALVIAGVTAVLQPRGVAYALVTLLGLLAACTVSPVFARFAVVAAAERLAAGFDRDAAGEPASWLFSLCDLKGRAYCRRSCECCC